MPDAVLEAITGLSTKFDSAASKFDLLNQRFDASEVRLTTLEKSFRESLTSKYGEGNDVPKKQWSWARYAFAIATKDWSVAPFEREECDKWRDVVSKTMQASSFTAGGSLIPPQYMTELISFLRPLLITETLGVRLLTGLVGSPVKLPKLNTGATAYWISPEGASVPASDQVTGNMEFQPHKVGALVKLSNDLVTLANPAIESIVRADIANALAEEIDKQFFQGTGTGGKPEGLSISQPAILVGDTAWTDNGTAAQNVPALVAMVREIDENNALRGRLSWACNPTSYWQIAQLVDTAGRPLMQAQGISSAATSVQTDMILGYPIRRSTLVSPTGAAATDDNLYFGNWDDAVIGVWSTMEFAASTETSTAFEKDELWIRAFARVDYGFRRNVSFIKLADVG